MKYLLNTWYVAAVSDEVNRQPLARTILDEKVSMFRGENGVGHAIGNVCPHRFAFLSKGKLIGDSIECPYHGLRFDASGACVFNPHGNGVIPQNARVKAYPLVERYGVFWIWMGNAANADQTMIPDFSALVQKGWADVQGYLQIGANYQLIIDNLMDLSHIQFLHPMLSSPGWIQKRVSVVSQSPGTVYCTNQGKDVQIFPIDRIIKPDALEYGEHRLDLRWTAPSNVFIDVRFITANEQMLHPIGHFLTPETDKSTHYFFRTARNQSVDNAELSREIGVQLRRAFSVEDEPMIEDQQANLEGLDLLSANPLILRSDNAAIRVRRVLSQMIEQENRPAG